MEVLKSLVAEVINFGREYGVTVEGWKAKDTKGGKVHSIVLIIKLAIWPKISNDQLIFLD